MAIIYPQLENILRFKVKPTNGELHLVKFLQKNLDNSYEVFFNPFLDGDRPDIIILKKDVGAFIIEVKDWSLCHYQIDHTNQWYVRKNTKFSKVPSPQSQAFRYKKNMYDLHLPIVGLARLKNPNFFKLIDCFAYFHEATKEELNQIYSKADNEVIKQLRETNFKLNNSQICDKAYNFRYDFLANKKKHIRRDKSIAISREQLDHLVKKITEKTSHVLFDEEIYKDFKRRLSPSEHTLKQGIRLKFDKKQLSLTKSENGKAKVKGVAGCGKTSILAQRAVNAFARHKSEVLILTFNITLKNYIKDKLSDIQGNRDLSQFEVSNYHQFFNSQLNNTEQDIVELVGQFGVEEMYRMNFFEGCNVPKYKTIFLDEIQDYEPQWVKIIRDSFLDNDGEMVLFGDESQDIYHRNSGRAQVIAQGFGRWNKFTRSYRTDFESPLNHLFKEFQLKYLTEKSEDPDVIETSLNQISMGFNILKYLRLRPQQWQSEVYDSISSAISSYSLNPNDVVILSSSIYWVRKLNEMWISNEKTSCMFDTYDELAVNIYELKENLISYNERDLNRLINDNKDTVERIRRAKKNHFYANSGLIKLSTIHSFKGLEAKTVFYILNEDDDAEMVYTAITRSTENLVILDISKTNKYSVFLKQNLATN